MSAPPPSASSSRTPGGQRRDSGAKHPLPFWPDFSPSPSSPGAESPPFPPHGLATNIPHFISRAILNHPIQTGQTGQTQTHRHQSPPPSSPPFSHFIHPSFHTSHPPRHSSSHNDFYPPSFTPRRQPYSARYPLKKQQPHPSQYKQALPPRQPVQNPERPSLPSPSSSDSFESESGDLTPTREDLNPHHRRAMGHKDKRRKAAARLSKTISEHVSDHEPDSVHGENRPSSVPAGVKDSHHPSEKVPTLTSVAPPTHSEPSSIRPSPPSSPRPMTDGNPSAHSRAEFKDKSWDGWGPGSTATQGDSKAAEENKDPPTPQAVPTWHGRTVVHGRHYPLVNGVAVPNPRPWGRGTSAEDVQASEAQAAPADTTATEADGDGWADDGGWGVDERLKTWVTRVQKEPPVPPPDSPTGPPPKALSDASSVSRPNSAREKAPPVTVFYSDSEALSPKSNKEPLDDKPEEVKDNTSHASTKPPSPEGSKNGDKQQGPGPGSGPRSFSRHSMVSSKPAASTGRHRRDEHSQKDKWWKRESHPMWCPSFSKQRIVVQTQFPVRAQELRTAMYDHFSRYGPIRCVVPCETFDKDSTDKVIIVFKDEASPERVLADPMHTECLFRSTYSRSGSSIFTLRVAHYPYPTLSYVWVKVTGRRFDSRSRSASPPREDDGGWGRPEEQDKRTLPERAFVYAVPRYLKRQEAWVHRAAVSDRPYEIFKDFCRGGSQGKDPILLKEIPLGHRYSEKDFLPQLVDYFVDIHDIVPPNEFSNGGWLFGLANDSEARHLMSNLAAIQGLTHRFARNTDRFPAAETPFSPIKGSETSAHDGGKGGSDSCSLMRELIDDEEPADDTVIVPPASLPAKPAESGLQSDEFPHLERKVVLTYRGRVLREEVVDGQPRYIDDAAIFVGRLVKEQETSLTLLKRFERYGKIVSVEYNPITSNGTYGTARVLFQDASSAKEAIACENGAVSFGSALKVEPRKVLPMDVQARAMYVDPNGRAVSPSMAHQYTPPPPTDGAAPLVTPASANRAPPPAPAPPYFSPSWYTAMGPAPQWMPPMFAPPPGDAASVGVPPEQAAAGRVPPMMPMMWQFGVGFYHPPYPPPPSMEPPKPAMSAPAFPSSAPVDPGLQTSMIGLSIGQPVTPVGAANAAAVPTTTSKPPMPVPVTAEPAEVPATKREGDDSKEGVKDESPLSPDSKNTLRARGSTFEDGVFKVIYDPDELKQYREEHKLKESPAATPATLPSPPSLESPILPLLPLHTGGHENHRRSASQASSYLDMNSGMRAPRVLNDFDAGGRRSSYATPMGNQFPEPIGSHIELPLAPHTYTYHPRVASFGEPRGRMGGGGGGGRRNGRNGRRFADEWPSPQFPPQTFSPIPPRGSLPNPQSPTLDPGGGW